MSVRPSVRPSVCPSLMEVSPATSRRYVELMNYRRVGFPMASNSRRSSEKPFRLESPEFYGVFSCQRDFIARTNQLSCSENSNDVAHRLSVAALCFFPSFPVFARPIFVPSLFPSHPLHRSRRAPGTRPENGELRAAAAEAALRRA